MKKSLLFFGKRGAKERHLPGISALWFRLMLIGLFVLSTGANAWAQSRTVTGTVLDETNAPLAGVAVSVEGTQRGAITDGTGKFSLPDVAADATLNFSFLGYTTQSVAVEGRSIVDVAMASDNTLLDEVVVVGYGSLRRSDVTGAVSRIDADAISERPVTNAVQAMQGRLAGVDIQTSSRPGTLGEVRVRGNRSITATNDPLYVIDGIPLVSSSMNDINPADIESIEVLKDASATAIYGSRAANGVILITTKRGQEGRTQINYDGSISFSKIHSLTDWMSSGERLDWQRQASLTGKSYGNPNVFTPESGVYGTAPSPVLDLQNYMGNQAYMIPVIESVYQLNNHDVYDPVLRPATAEEIAMGYSDMVPVYDPSNMFYEDWVDHATRVGVSQTHNLSLSAGTERSSLYMSLGYLKDNPAQADQSFERFTVNMNGSISPLKWLRVSNVLQANYAIQDYGMFNQPSNNGGAKDSYGLAVGREPYAPAYYLSGEQQGELLTPGKGNGPSDLNLISNMQNGYNENRSYGAMNTFSAEVTLLPWLKYQYRLGAQFRHRREGSYYDRDWVNPTNAPATDARMANNVQETAFNWEMENLLFAHKEFGRHMIDATLLQSANEQRSEGIHIRVADVTFPTSLWYNVGANDQNRPFNGNDYGTEFSTRKLASYMARINYSFNDRYLLTASARWDGSSVLARGHKWDFFPSVALAWKMEQEEFIRRVPWIQQLKLRLGYGVTGSQSVDPYKTTGTLAAFNVNFNNTGVSGYRAGDMINYGLGWEKTAQTNVGLDFALLDFRVNGSLEYYIANTSDLLLNRTIPVTLGYPKVLSNVGRTRNQGVEITLSTINVRSGDFTWTTDLNWTRNREEIVELSNGKVDEPVDNRYIGHPQGAIRVSQVDRLWQDTPEDRRLMEIYQQIGSKNTYYPGLVKLVDQQPMEVVEAGTPNSTKVTLSTGEVLYVLNNGFGTIDADNDKVIIGSRRPDWTAGMTNTFTYRNWSFNFFVHARVGGLYHGMLHTLGRRVEHDTWTPTNTDARFPRIGIPPSGKDHSDLMNWTSATIYSVRNIALSYTFPQSFLDRLQLSSGSVYVQVLNPFIFGSKLIRLGINPDDANGWTGNNGGITNNTMLMRSYVVGLRLGF